MNRCRSGEQIFLEESDFKAFLELLMETEICRVYGLKPHSSASSVVERVKGQMTKDRQFSKRVDELVQMLNKRQKET
jgi:hypothetical protein